MKEYAVLQSRVGNKIYFTVNGDATGTFLTRQEARENKGINDILVEVPLSRAQRTLLQRSLDNIGVVAEV